MALSRVWSYIILFSIIVACYHYINGDKNIFNDLVTEKKLKENESFSNQNMAIPFSLSATNDSIVNALTSKMKAANFNITEDLLKANYIVTDDNDDDKWRNLLKQKLEAVAIINFKNINNNLKTETDSAAAIYVHSLNDADKTLLDTLISKSHLHTSENILAAKYVVTSSTNTDSLSKTFLLRTERIKMVSAEKLFYYLPKNIDGIFETGKFAITLVLGLIGTLALFMGLLSIAEHAGGINVISRFMSPFLSKLFPGVPKNHPSIGHMVMNFSANILGLDNAATPFGLKAMQSLQDINPNKDKATDAQIMFLALHASGLTLIPVSIIAVRAANGSMSPNEIFIPLILSTFVCSLTAMLITSFKQRINILQPLIFFPLFIITSLLTVFVWYLKSLPAFALEQFSDSFSNGAILFVFLIIVAGGMYKRINIFDAFVEGAKGGFETAVRIIPYMVGMLVAVSLLRTSGAFDLVINPIKTFIAFTGMDTQWAEGLPTALLRPFSAGGARGFMIDAMRTYGPDSFIGKMVCVLQGSSETTFYVVALYFGSVAIKDTRYSIPVMLLADLAGIIFSVCICYYLWS